MHLGKFRIAAIALVFACSAMCLEWKADGSTVDTTDKSAAKTSAKTHTVQSTANKNSASVKKTGAKSKKSSLKSKNPPKKRGQQAIEPQRATEIQTALVKAGYLKDEHVSGKIDDRTKDALMRLQAENGWQTKIVPDSRALIKLGLGPDHSAVINKDTAVLSSVPKAKAEVPDK